MAPPIPRWLSAALASAALVAAVTVVIALLEPHVPALGLGVLYLLAVVPIALAYGLAVASAVSVTSMAAFSYLFLPPRYNLDPGTPQRWSVLVAFLVSSLVVGELAARSRREARRSGRLADEQAALRRMAELAVRGVPPPELFAAVAREVGLLLGVDATHMGRYELDGTATVVAAWSSAGDHLPVGMRVDLEGDGVSGSVWRTGRPARMGGYERASGPVGALGRDLGLRASVGAPIVIDQDLWGVMIASSTTDGRLPADAEARITAFTELTATAIANAESRAGLARLAEAQAALRRVATLVAHGTSPEELFAAVLEEAGRVFPVEYVGLARYESDGTMTTVAISSRLAESFPVGGNWPLGGKNVSTVVAQTGRSARIDDYSDADGRLGFAMRERGLDSSVGAPIVVEGHLWGVMTLASPDHPLPADAEARLASFTELVATAIANTEARTEVGRLAETHAALRRVATLVARGVPQGELFDAVTEEVTMLLGADLATMVRLENDDTLTVVAGSGPPAAGVRFPLGESTLATRVVRTGRAARMDADDDLSPRLVAIRETLGIRSSVASPILVEGKAWGGLVLHSRQTEPLPADTESRLEGFTDLVATAVSNAQARAEVQRLADEQAALRRVATVVARESPPTEVFAVVAEEVLRVLGVELARLYRYEPDGTATLLADAGDEDTRVGVGTRVAIEGRDVSALVRQTGRPARLDDHADATGPVGLGARELGVRCAVGTPIVVRDRLWGVIVAGSRQPAPLPARSEARLAEFTELVATAIANAEARTEVAASRARIVAATDVERRRVVRDLHDGAQQRIVHTIITLKLAKRALEQDQQAAPTLVSEALDNAEEANVELRELAHGILPAVLTQGGLRAGLDALASRMPVPVELDVPVGRLPTAVEATAYFVVAEALTNVAKHARAGHAEVTARIENGTLAVQVRDDGVGGARLDGSGLTGLADRVAALKGKLRVESEADGGTLVAAAIPLAG